MPPRELFPDVRGAALDGPVAAVAGRGGEVVADGDAVADGWPGPAVGAAAGRPGAPDPGLPPTGRRRCSSVDGTWYPAATGTSGRRPKDWRHSVNPQVLICTSGIDRSTGRRQASVGRRPSRARSRRVEELARCSATASAASGSSTRAGALPDAQPPPGNLQKPERLRDRLRATGIGLN